jgi:hypothetical protein
MNPTFTNFYSHIMLWICRHDGLHTVTFLLVDQNMNNDPRHRKVGITRNLALQISKLGGFILYGAFIMSNYENSFKLCMLAYYHMSGVMVGMVVSSVVDFGFES